MAITILLEPQEFQPVYNEVITVLSSTNSGQPNFQYVIDVNVDGVNTSRIKVTPNPDGYGVVDLHKHLEPFVNSDIDYSETDTFQLLPNSFIKYDVTLAEQYVIEITGAAAIDTGGFVAWQGQFAADQHHLQVGDKIRISNSVGVNYDGVATVTAITSATRIVTNTVYTGAASADYQRADGSPTNVSSLAVFTGEKFANNSVLNWLDVPSFDEDDYKINSTNVGLLLTTTQTNYVKPESKCYLNFFNSFPNGAGILEVTTSNGVYHVYSSHQLAGMRRVRVLVSDSQTFAQINAEKAAFEFLPGPLFCDLLLADEINRAPAKTQSALLEAMQESQVSVDGETHDLSPVFTTIATQNPIEYEGTYPLPEAQLDRFMFKSLVGYPQEEHERDILHRYHAGFDANRTNTFGIEACTDPREMAEIRAAVRNLRVAEPVMHYITSIVRATRDFHSLTLGASPRAGVILFQASRGLAVLRGRKYVTPDDVRDLARPVLRHRLILTPEAEIEQITTDDVAGQVLERLPVPRLE